MNLRENNKPKLEDKEVISNVTGEDFSRKELMRVFAVGLTFTNTTFKQSVLSSCYFRNCSFIKCDFTGATVKDSNFKGARFEDCGFKYTHWEKTLLEESFLETCLPSEENLARDLVRSLRVNFTQIGNYEAVNRAAAIEVRLTGQHLYNAAYSRQAYYRSKYKGLARIVHGIQHLRWKALDLLWGNGESILRIVIAAFVAVAVIALIYAGRDDQRYWPSFLEALWHFWGLIFKGPLPPIYSLLLAVTRYVALGLFMAVLVKRLSRR